MSEAVVWILGLLAVGQFGVIAALTVLTRRLFQIANEFHAVTKATQDRLLPPLR